MEKNIRIKGDTSNAKKLKEAMKQRNNIRKGKRPAGVTIKEALNEIIIML